MHAAARRLRTTVAAAVLGLVAGVVMGVPSPAPALAGDTPSSTQEDRTQQHPVRPMCPDTPAPGTATCMSVVRTDVGGPVGRTAATDVPEGYGPGDLQDAYDVPSQTGGAGATVAIVVAFDSPTAEADLAVYRAQFGLPACTSGNGCFRKVDQRGGTAFPAGDPGWAGEAALDLDMVSAICPSCSLLLVEADDNSLGNLAAAVGTAVRLGAKYVSNSWGGLEFDDQVRIDEEFFNQPGVVITASSGNAAYGPFTPFYPASSPYVTAVGGTSLRREDNLRGWSESVWAGASSGCSKVMAKPAFQTDPDCPRRTVADVAAIADPQTGVAIYHTYGAPGWLVTGGTSTAAPIIAATYALAGDPGAGSYPNTYPYANAAGLNDVTTGASANCDGTYFCAAREGYDGATGLGTPAGLLAFSPPGPHGTVTGRVTDAATRRALAGATVSTDGASVRTDADGRYAMSLPVGAHELTASMFGYGAGTATVTVTQDATVTANLALRPQDRITLRGTVRDGSGHGWPLYAKVEVPGTPIPAVYTNPVSGRYHLSVPAGEERTLRITPQYPGYPTVEQQVRTDNGDVRRDVALPIDAESCSAPGYRLNYDGPTQTFDGTGTPEGWTVTDNNGSGGVWRFDNPFGRGNLTGGGGGFADMYSFGEGFEKSQDTDLVSPVLDLTGHAQPVVNFRTNYVSLSSTADVDLSVDGGTTWTNVFHRGSEPDERIDGEAQIELPLPQAANQSQVRVRFHFTGHVLGWWQVDSVFVGNRSCDPVPAGLVVGHVHDGNTGRAIDGATVSTPGGATATTAATPDDPALRDGFYWTTATPSWRGKVTAARPHYTTTTRTVRIPADWTARGDITLGAGHLVIWPRDVSFTQPVGGVRTRTVTFLNDGTAPVQVRLQENDGTGPAVATATDEAGSSGAPLIEVPGDYRPGRFDPDAAGDGDAQDRTAGEPFAEPWTAIADYPTSIMDNAVATAPDGKVYSVGGVDGRAIIPRSFVYDPAAGTWSSIRPMANDREMPSAAFLDGKLHVVGGWGHRQSRVNAMEIYDPATGTWSTGPAVPTAYAASGVGVLNGQLYLVGGCEVSCGKQDVFVYDPPSQSWSRIADYPRPASWLGCGALGGRLYCAGGFAGAGPTAAGYAYDPATRQWSPIADMPAGLWGGSYTAANGKLIISGGIEPSGALTNQGYAYDPASDSWSAIANSNNVVYRAGSGCGFYKIGGSINGQFAPVARSEVLPGADRCGPTDIGWLAANRTSFTVQPGRSVTVTLTADAHLPGPGTYTGQVELRTDTPYTLAPVGVTLRAR